MLSPCHKKRRDVKSHQADATTAACTQTGRPRSQTSQPARRTSHVTEKIPSTCRHISFLFPSFWGSLRTERKNCKNKNLPGVVSADERKGEGGGVAKGIMQVPDGEEASCCLFLFVVGQLSREPRRKKKTSKTSKTRALARTPGSKTPRTHAHCCTARMKPGLAVQPHVPRI